MANDAAAYIASATAQTAWYGLLRETNWRMRETANARAIRAAASGKAHMGQAAYAAPSRPADRIPRRGEPSAPARTEPDLLDRRVLRPAARRRVRPHRGGGGRRGRGHGHAGPGHPAGTSAPRALEGARPCYQGHPRTVPPHDQDRVGHRSHRQDRPGRRAGPGDGGRARRGAPALSMADGVPEVGG